MILINHPPATTLNDSPQTTSIVRQILLTQLPPAGFTPEVIEGMFRKALRLRIWRNLRPEARALILALRKWTGKIKSSTLKNVLEEIYIEIELSTLKGKALLYGITIALKDKIIKNITNLKETIKNLKKIVCLGISYLSNPPLYRHLG